MYRSSPEQNDNVLHQPWPCLRLTGRLWLLLTLLLLSANPFAWAQPDNDLFANRTPLVGTNFSLLASGTEAGQEPGEPSLAGQPSARTVWWSWTAPADGRLIVNVSAEGVLWAAIHTFSGDQLSNLVEIPSTAREHNVFVVAAGRDYAIQVVLQSNHEVFRFQTKFQPLTYPPANDAFANAQTLISNTGPVLGSAIGASRESGEPVGVTNSVWYAWTAPADGVAGLQALSPGPNFALFTGSDPDHLTLLATQAGWMEFYCQAGVTYHVRVTLRWAEDFFFGLKSFHGRVVEPQDGAQFLAGEPVTLRAELTPWDAPGTAVEFWVGTDVVARSTNAPHESVWVAWPGSNLPIHVQPVGWEWPMVQASRRVHVSATYAVPGNDGFQQRTFLATLPTVLEGDARGATPEPGEPAHGYAVPMHTVWYSWTAPSNALVSIRTSPFQPEVVRFYSGTLLGALQPVTPIEVLGLQVKAGATYQIAVDSSEARRFQVYFTVKVEPPNFNDAFSARQTLMELPVTLTNVLSAATTEIGEPAAPNAGEHSLWYAWQAPSNGVLTLRCDVSFVSRELFTGTELSSLTPVAARTETWNQNEFWVEAGASYQLRISGAHTGDWLGAFSAVVWSASFEPVPANDHLETRQLLAGTSGHVLANGHLLNNGTMWYEWVAPGPGVFTSSHEVTLYTGNDSLHLLPLTMTGEGIVVTQGMSIKLACRGSGGWPDAFDYTFYAASTNDQFAGALELIGSSAHISGHTYGAGRERGEPSHGPGFAGRTIWYRWTAPGPGWLAVAAQIAGQYQGQTLTSLLPVSSALGSHFGAALTFGAQASQQYHVAVDGLAGQFGPLDFLLHLNAAAAPMPMAMAGSLPSTTNPTPTCRIVRTSSGAHQIEISGGATQPVRVQISADLKSWADWGEPLRLSAEGTFVLTDPDQQPQRFYRVRLVE